MRYELREWTTTDKTAYTVRISSDERDSLKAYMARPSIPNDLYYRLHIVDTETENA